MVRRAAMLATFAPFVAAAAAAFAAPPAAVPATLEQSGHHLAFELGVGGGFVSMASEHAAIKQLNLVLRLQGATIDGDASVNHELHTDFAFRWVTPWHFGLKVGLGTMLAFPTEVVGTDILTNWTAMVEVPVVFSWAEPWLDGRLTTELGLGPDVLVWSIHGQDCACMSGNVAQEVDSAVGLLVEGAGQYWLSPGFALGLSVAYRALSNGPLHERSSTNPPYYGGAGYSLDFSGVRAVGTLNVRFF